MMGRKLRKKSQCFNLGQWVNNRPFNHVNCDAIQQERAQWYTGQWKCEDNEFGFELWYLRCPGAITCPTDR